MKHFEHVLSTYHIRNMLHPNHMTDVCIKNKIMSKIKNLQFYDNSNCYDLIMQFFNSNAKASKEIGEYNVIQLIRYVIKEICNIKLFDGAIKMMEIKNIIAKRNKFTKMIIDNNKNIKMLEQKQIETKEDQQKKKTYYEKVSMKFDSLNKKKIQCENSKDYLQLHNVIEELLQDMDTMKKLANQLFDIRNIRDNYNKLITEKRDLNIILKSKKKKYENQIMHKIIPLDVGENYDNKFYQELSNIIFKKKNLINRIFKANNICLYEEGWIDILSHFNVC